ncbi:MAG: hypothetical protein IJ779_08085 [Ruminococcus sp.]|nr:hypothetical protein [Ruminococcus sp.]
MKRTVIAAALLIFSLAGCGVKDMKQDEIMSYLERHYDRSFTFISSEKVPRSQRNYLDSRIEPAETVDDVNSADDIVDVYEDEKGLQFHVWHYLKHGVVGSWMVEDDYSVQWLMSQPELYQKLEDSPYNCTYHNYIGKIEKDGGNVDRAGFTLTVSELEDIRPAAELAFEVIGNDAAILPDHGIYKNKDDIRNKGYWQAPIIPWINIQTENGDTLESVKFRTEQIQWTTDRENFIRSAECEYIALANSGKVKEKLTAEQKKQQIDEYIPLYNGDKEICRLERNYGSKYRITDSVPLGERLEFANLKTICESCGYTFKPKGNKLYITKGSDTVLISRRSGEGYNRSIFAVYKNDTPYITEGDIDDVLQTNECSLTIADYQNLFGITITVDYSNHTACLNIK